MMDAIIPEAEAHSLSPDNEYESFVQDDLEFRTITTILHALQYRDTVTVRNFGVVPKSRPFLKILPALSSLIARNQEIIAILPKHLQRGVALLIGFNASRFDDEENFISTPTSPSSPRGRLSHHVTQNAQEGDPKASNHACS